MMNVLIADSVEQELIAGLEAMGATVDYKPELNAETLPKAIGAASVLIVRSTAVTAEAIKAGPRLSLIVRAGAGVNTIDLKAASARGTYVANCPGMNTAAVAELAMGLMISADRGIPDATHALRAGKWDKKRIGNARGLKGRTLGIVGTGQIGTAVARRAHAFEMRVIAWSRNLNPKKAEALGAECMPTLTELARRSDVVSVHLALAPETKNIFNKAFFDAMKPGAIFINTARGEVVDHAALSDAIAAKGLKVGLDVFDAEPTAGQAPFEQTALVAKISGTPHIGASTDQASMAIAMETLEIIRNFKQTGRPTNIVNIRKALGCQNTLIIRHYNRVGVLARVLEILREEGINIEEMQNLIFQTNEAACCSLAMDTAPSPTALQKLKADKDIIEVLV